jgi:hypothetical protein
LIGPSSCHSPPNENNATNDRFWQAPLYDSRIAQNDVGRKPTHLQLLTQKIAQIEKARSLGRKFVARVAPWFPLALFVFAIVYYSAYAFSGLDLNGEGGTIAVVADRIRHGYRPFVDTFLGYNLLWFYPIVWLFRIFGPNFTLVRIFFFALSVLMALLAYRTVLRVTHRPLLSLATGTILVLIPGIQFRNYLPFFGVVNLMAILEAFTLPHRRQRTRLIWILIASLLVSTTFLVRIDLGLFFSAVFIGGSVAYAFLGTEDRTMRLQTLLSGALLLPITFFVLHQPIGLYAQAHGFADDFWNQYTGEFADLGYRVEHLLPHPPSPKATPAIRKSTPSPDAHLAQRSPETPTPPPPAEALSSSESSDRSTRPLPRWTDMFTSRWGKTRILVFLTYYPLIAGMLIGCATLALALNRLVTSSKQTLSRTSRPVLSTSSGQSGTDALILGISLASAFTLFPQYFFFRPDPQHISEMMCVFLITLACSCGIALDRVGSCKRWLRRLLIAWIALCLFSVYLYCDYGLAIPWMGSIARKKPNEVWFKADNNVIALLPPTEAEETRQLYELLKMHANRHDYVTCFPYAPTVNFMTNRRSYLYNLYVDNVNRPIDFDAKAIADIQRYKPAAILINDDPMNVVNASRFSVWAAPTLAYIQQHYRYAGTFRRNDVYLAPDK